ncbi:TolC family protein [Catalinimonas alkaloidigena]|uniref:TolC family protein n=1 Tax=Catalinimonas alkaloidigena TaxID=1075417 RepID=UPI0015A2483E|nr:TolC family protein [Catalinimonas alkaloidigena]
MLPLHAQDVLTLTEALSLGLEKNYAIRIAQLQRDSLDNQLTLGNAGFLPVITADGTRQFSVNDTRQVFLDGRNNALDNARTDVLNGSIDATWRIFDGFNMFVAYESLTQLRKVGEFTQRAAIENLVADITDAYYNVVQQTARVRAFENTLTISEQRLQLAQDNYEVGTGTRAEYLAAQADLNTDRSALMQEQQLLKQAIIQVNALLVRSPIVEFAVADTLIPLGDSLQFQELTDELGSANTELRQARLRRDIALLRTRAVKSQRYPQVDVYGSYSYNRSNSQAGFLLQNRQVGYTYGVTARINIFDGFNQNRREQNARVTERIREAQVENTQIGLESVLAQVYNDYVNSLRLIQLEQENYAISQERVSIELDRYRIGVSTPLQLREAQTTTVETNRRLIEAQYTAKQAETELLRLTGRLVNTTN